MASNKQFLHQFSGPIFFVAEQKTAGAKSGMLDDALAKLWVDFTLIDIWETAEKVKKKNCGNMTKTTHSNWDAIPRTHRPSYAGTGKVADEDSRRHLAGFPGHASLKKKPQRAEPWCPSTRCFVNAWQFRRRSACGRAN